ncbi:MAG: amidohydrolase [bacterium]|nr:amidohydrolase [bacterium]
MTTPDLLQRARDGQSLAAIGIIDMHAHMGPDTFAIPETSAASIVAAMDLTGIATTVVGPMLPSVQDECDAANAAVAEAVRAFPGRLLGYLRALPAQDPWPLSKVEQWVDQGFTGIKLHNIVGVPYTHPSYHPFFEVANERRMPVLFHSWGQDQEFREFREIAQAYPNLNLLLAHTAASNEAGYVAIASEFDNVYLELATTAGPRGLVDRLVENPGADRVVWGSDVCFINQAQQLGKVIGARIPDDDKVRILSGNARRILDRVRT